MRLITALLLSGLMLHLSGCKIGTFADLSIGPQKKQPNDNSAVDTTTPILSEVIPITFTVNDNAPFYTFHSSEEGDITYYGDCVSLDNWADEGDNSIQFTDLEWDKEFTNCQLTVTNADNNESERLDISDFKIIKSTVLNDTGITDCGNYSLDWGSSTSGDNNVECDPLGNSGNGVSINDEGYLFVGNNDIDFVPPGQDALFGRDVNPAYQDDSDGKAGFSFTKIGQECIEDNVTGLVWEAKTTTVGLHYYGDSFSWYSSDNTLNGGEQGGQNSQNTCFGYNASDASTYCNTQAYVARVNAEKLCGYEDWRLPSKEEIQSISYKGQVKPAFDVSVFEDIASFPNYDSVYYWASSSSARAPASAWVYSLLDGRDYVHMKSEGRLVRLVRGAY